MNNLLDEFLDIKLELLGYGQYIAQKDSSLLEILNSMKVCFLKDLADRVLPEDLYFQSKKYKKQELIKCIYDFLLSDHYINVILMGASNTQLELVNDLIKGDIINPNENFDIAMPLYFNGIIFVDFLDDDNISLILPRELKDILESKIPLIDYKERGKCMEVYKYAKAIVNLYGVMPIDKTLDIYNHYHPARKMKLENFLDYFIPAQVMQKDIFMFEDLLYCEHIAFRYEESEEFLVDILIDREGIPFYYPSKEEFEKYEDVDYFEPNVALNKFNKFIQNKVIDKKEADALYKGILLMIRSDESFDEIFDLANDLNLMFTNDDQLQEFVNLLVIISNNSRKWVNAGHTPLDLRKFNKIMK